VRDLFRQRTGSFDLFRIVFFITGAVLEPEDTFRAAHDMGPELIVNAPGMGLSVPAARLGQLAPGPHQARLRVFLELERELQRFFHLGVAEDGCPCDVIGRKHDVMVHTRNIRNMP